MASTSFLQCTIPPLPHIYLRGKVHRHGSDRRARLWPQGTVDGSRWLQCRRMAQRPWCGCLWVEAIAWRGNKARPTPSKGVHCPIFTARSVWCGTTPWNGGLILARRRHGLFRRWRTGVARASIRYNRGTSSAVDSVERESSKPAFQALLYPAIPHHLNLSKATSPAFLACGEDLGCGTTTELQFQAGHSSSSNGFSAPAHNSQAS
jgi:hypothetical protein